MSYASQCTDNQLRNVLCDKADRYQRHNGEGEVAEGSRTLYWECREEMARRGFDSDEELRSRGIEPI